MESNHCRDLQEYIFQVFHRAFDCFHRLGSSEVLRHQANLRVLHLNELVLKIDGKYCIKSRCFVMRQF